MELKSYEAYGLTLALAGNTDGVTVTRVSIPMLGKAMYAISSEDGKVDISINPEEQEDYMDTFRDGVSQLYNYLGLKPFDSKTGKLTADQLHKERVLEMRTVDILNQNKYNIADNCINPPMRVRGTYTSFLDMFKMSEFASQDFATLHTATTLAGSLYHDLNTTTISEMLKALNSNRDSVEDYMEMGEEIAELQSLVDSGMASDINEAFEILHRDDPTDEDEDLPSSGK